MSWYESSKAHIAEIHASLPTDATLEQRRKALQGGYPFGQRQYFPYKMWLKAQREYLTRYAPPDHDSKRFPLSPLERMIAKAKAS
jgi:hypothetical protein